jgi:Undecaprenyl-phosphate glucose phosphotransferase
VVAESPTQSACISKSICSGAVRGLDSLTIATSAALVYLVYVANYDISDVEPYFAAVLICIVLQLNVFHFADVYKFDRLSSLSYQVRRVFLAWLFVFFALVTFGFLLKLSASYSRVWTVAWFALSFVGLLGTRIALTFLFQRWRGQGRLSRAVIVIGAGKEGARLLELFSRDETIMPLGYFDDRGDDRVPAQIGRWRKLGAIRDSVAFAQDHQIDAVVIALPWRAEERILQTINMLRVLPVDIRLGPETLGLRLAHAQYSQYSGVPLLNVLDRPLNDWQMLAKAIEDRVLAFLLLIAFSPLLLGVALAVKLTSPGPVLFRQKRYGFNNKLFQVYKFRTMFVERTDANAERLVERNDPRVTPLGRWLRRTSIDELPQLLNVLRGQMSLVGPRPHAVSAKAVDRFYADVVKEYAARHRVRPGITGWAQINGWRGETNTVEKLEQRVSHDLHYIENWSLALDLKIMLLTIPALLKDRNAY